MKNLFFIINCGENHRTIKNMGSGASELLFYYTAFKLSKYYNITIFNRSKPEIIDNINYLYLPDNYDLNLNDINNECFIIQRFFDKAIFLHKKNNTNKFIVWSHDYLENNLENFIGIYKLNEINEYFTKNNFKIVSVSNFHNNNIKNKFNDIEIITIYNALFPELYLKNNINKNNNQIIFASNWAKGLDKILNICNKYYQKNNDLKLILIKPSYCDWEPDLSKYSFIKCLGNIKNKEEYCKLIQSSALVLTTSYPETFGCVFAESLHLGVPVLADNSIKSGFLEIIDKEYQCNFNNIEEVIILIEKIKKENKLTNLREEFYEENVIKKWIELIS